MYDLIINVIIALIVAFVVGYYFHYKSKEELKKIMRRIFREGKRQKLIIPSEFQIKSQIEPEIQIKPRFESEIIHPPVYVIGKGKTTTDPVIKELFDYSKRKLGEKIIDNLIDSVFSTDEDICPECGAEVDYDDIECSECGADLEEEE